MKKLASFGIAVMIFLSFLTAVHICAITCLPKNDKELGYWVSYEKDASYLMLSENIADDASLILGSSELRRFKRNVCNPYVLFNRDNLDVMCIGSAVNQSLNHAILVAALGPKVHSGKVVLILSPTWFYSDRDSAGRYGMRFSKTFYHAAISNNSLTPETRNKIRSITRDAFGGSEPVDFMEQEKDISRSVFAWLTSGQKDTRRAERKVQSGDIDFGRLMSENEQTEGNRLNRRFNMYKNAKMLLPGVFDESKGKNRNKNFETSNEYEYLQLFLDVCREHGIKPMLVLQPMNGKWYDYTGLSKEKRQVCYDRIREIASKNNVELADFSNDEYTQGFFSDSVHPSKKGWLMINEQIYKYIK